MTDPRPEPNRKGNGVELNQTPVRPRRRWVRRLAWAVAFLVFCELILRFVFGLGYPLLYVQDADCAYLPKPDQHIRRFFCTNAINAQSMRSAPIIAPKPAGEFRVLLVGDSVLYGMTHVDQSKIATSILARELPAQLHRPVEVLNASAGGWAVGNELGFIRSRGIFHADLVIFVLNTYDLTQPFNDAVPGEALVLPSHNPPLALWESWDRYIKPRLFHISVADPGATAPPVTDTKSAVQQTLRWLSEANQIAVSNGAKFAIVYSPVVGTNYKPIPESRDAIRELRQWASAPNVPFLDLTGDYAASAGRDVFYDGIHLNPPGQAIMAAAIEKWPPVHDFARP